MRSQKGFVTTLESILAATVFLIFLVNVLPSFISTNPEAEILERQADSIIDTLDRSGDMRDDAKARNLSAIESSISEYMNGVNLAIGLGWTNRTDGTFSSGTTNQNFTHNSSQIKRERVLIWIDSADSLTVDVNNQEILSTSSSGFYTEPIGDYTEQGQNNITIDGTSASGHYTIEQYYYQQSQDLPSADAIYGTSHVFSTNSTDNEPRELQVYIWR